VSPVLQGEDGLEKLRACLEAIRTLGIQINSSCGFHVHVAATGLLSDLRNLQRVVQCFVALENAFDAIVSRAPHATTRHTNRHRYCQSNVLAMGGLMLNRQRWDRIAATTSVAELVRLANPDLDRYRKLNLTNIAKEGRPSTIEFRQHGGVDELLAAEAWVRLVVASCWNAAHDDSTRHCLLPQDGTAADELRALFRLVACDGLESFYLQDRRLYQLSQQQQQWRCMRCRRRFPCSRALSQHCESTGHR
jgi:Putative amidoligase enzyme